MSSAGTRRCKRSHPSGALILKPCKFPVKPGRDRRATANRQGARHTYAVPHETSQGMKLSTSPYQSTARRFMYAAILPARSLLKPARSPSRRGRVRRPTGDDQDDQVHAKPALTVIFHRFKGGASRKDGQDRTLPGRCSRKVQNHPLRMRRCPSEESLATCAVSVEGQLAEPPCPQAGSPGPRTHVTRHA
jgi:hypothetical protein